MMGNMRLFAGKGQLTDEVITNLSFHFGKPVYWQDNATVEQIIIIIYKTPPTITEISYSAHFLELCAFYKHYI